MLSSSSFARLLVVPAMLGFMGLGPAALAQVEPFSRTDCVRRLTSEVDRPYRLSRQAATKRCDEIQQRVTRLSRDILGTWTRRTDRGQTESIEFRADGRAVMRFYSSRTRRVETETRPWAIVNPYGTVGSEVLDLYPYLASAKIAGDRMDIQHQPASYGWVERWTRVAGS